LSTPERASVTCPLCDRPIPPAQADRHHQFKRVMRAGTEGPDRVLVNAEARGKRAGQLFKALTRSVDVVTTAAAWASKANNPALALAVETLGKGTRSA